MIEVLQEERWGELTDTFKDVFDAELPHKGKSTILVDIQDGEIKGFVVFQMVALIGQIWNTGSKTRMMLDILNHGVKPGNTVITIADTPRLERLAERFGMRKETGSVFRKDFIA